MIDIIFIRKKMRKYKNSSILEKIFLKISGEEPWYTPAEKIKSIIAPDFPTLGKLSALRFIEWLVMNPQGTISLPTGKTPEYFIHYTTHYLSTWNKKETQKELDYFCIDTKKKPNMAEYTFIQIDEFYPMNPDHENSFNYYIKRFYVDEFGFDISKVIFMDTWKIGVPSGKNLGNLFPDGKVDLSLRYRQPVNTIEKLQQKAIIEMDKYAMEYEKKIEEYGGLGFFLGGIGPDGHIGFNIKGSDHFSTTRLISINYETAAAAATDLGGIEVSRNKKVLTIGLDTITKNPTTTAIVMVAGESKADIVKESMENNPSILYPATALQSLSASRFYLTKGAAKFLTERKYNELSSATELDKSSIEKVILNISNIKRKKILDLKEKDLKQDKFGSIILAHIKDLKEEKTKIITNIKNRIKVGTENIDGLVFLHTAPHHDDIMAGYLPYIIHLVRSPKNIHYFVTFTSGFTSVSNSYTFTLLDNLEIHLKNKKLDRLLEEKKYFSPDNNEGKNRDVYLYLDGIAAKDIEIQKEAEARRMLRNFVEITGTQEVEIVLQQIKNIKNYFTSAYPGKKDPPDIQKLKGMIREWEEELMWGHLGFNSENIFHLRLPFYTGDIFTAQPEWGKDILPIVNIINKINPDIITTAFDPEASGPDTHYKVLQALAEAVKTTGNKSDKRKIWGYRNVWSSFHPSEANIYVPVSMNSLAIINNAFYTCFGSQRTASFPSYEYDGPFSELIQKIMVEQYNIIKVCLGRDFFYSNPIPRLRATRALNFLKEMDCEEFVKEAAALKKLTGNL
jgi:glucosamine-6-phosphate deaminase